MGFVGRIEYKATWTCDECGKTINLKDDQYIDDMLDRTVLVPIPAPADWAIMRWKEKAVCPVCIDKVLDSAQVK